jgi:hypothetical protein
MSRGLAGKSNVSVIITYVYIGSLAALLVGFAAFVRTSFQPTRLANPGVAAFHVSAALAVYPPPPLYSSPVPEVAADAELQAASSATVAEAVQREPAGKSPARKKSKRTASRLRDRPAQYVMTPSQFQSYGYVGPGERR